MKMIKILFAADFSRCADQALAHAVFLADKYDAELDKSGARDNPIDTEISSFTKFHSAEGYHQDYYNNNQIKVIVLL